MCYKITMNTYLYRVVKFVVNVSEYWLTNYFTTTGKNLDKKQYS